MCRNSERREGDGRTTSARPPLQREFRSSRTVEEKRADRASAHVHHVTHGDV
jgi:hypothetical protein